MLNLALVQRDLICSLNDRVLSILMPKSSTESLDLIFKHSISTGMILFDFLKSTFEIYQDLLQDTKDTRRKEGHIQDWI